MQTKPRPFFFYFFNSLAVSHSRSMGDRILKLGWLRWLTHGFRNWGVMVVMLWSIGYWVVAVWLAWVIGFVSGPFVLLMWTGWKRLSWLERIRWALWVSSTWPQLIRVVGPMFWLMVMVLRPCPKMQSASFIFHGCDVMLMNF